MYYKIKDRDDVVKDSVTGAILKVDKKAAEEYLRQKNIINNNRKNQEELSEIKNKITEIDSLKQDVNEIKFLLKELLNKGQ